MVVVIGSTIIRILNKENPSFQKHCGANDDGEGILHEAPRHFWTNRDLCKGLKSIQIVDISCDTLCVTYGVLHPGLPLSLRLSFFFCKLLLLLPFVKQRLLPTSSPLHVSSLQSQLASIRLWPTIRFLYLLTTTTFDTTGKLYFTDIGHEMVQKINSDNRSSFLAY